MSACTHPGHQSANLDVCAHNFLKVIRCEWGVLWHRKASVCWNVECRGRRSVSVIASEPDGGIEWYPERSIGKKARIFHPGCILNTNQTQILFLFLGVGVVYPWVVLSSTVMVHLPGSIGGFWCLMWSELDHIWGKEESDSLVLQLSHERNESVHVASLCVHVWAQWKMAGNKHSWHTRAPIHIQFKGFLGGISHIFIPFVHILECWIHLEDFVLLIFHFDTCTEPDFVLWSTRRLFK